MREPPTMHRVPYGHEELEFMVPPWFEVDVAGEVRPAGEYDVVIGAMGAPHDADLVRALDVAARRCAALVRKGGALVVPAQLADGAGDPEPVPGAFEGRLVVIAASEAPEAVRLAGLRAAVDVEEALDIAYEHIGRPKRASLLIVPRAMHTLPVVTAPARA